MIHPKTSRRGRWARLQMQANMRAAKTPKRRAHWMRTLRMMRGHFPQVRPLKLVSEWRRVGGAWVRKR